MKYLITLLILITINSSYSQDLNYNRLYITPGFVDMTFSEMDSFFAGSLNFGYSTYISKKLFIDASIGRGHFNGNTRENFVLRDDEKSFLNLTSYHLGLGYSLIRNEKISIAATFHYSIFRYKAVTGIIGDGQGNIFERSVDLVSNNNYLLGFRVENTLSEHVSWITDLGYGPLRPRVQVLTFNTGIAFTF